MRRSARRILQRTAATTPIVVLIAFLPSLAAGRAQTDLIDRVREAWAARESRFRTFDVQWDQQTTTPRGTSAPDARGNARPATDVTHPLRFRLICDGKQVRLQRTGTEFDLDAND